MTSSAAFDRTGTSRGLSEVLLLAGKNKWCTKRYCTTCGATDYRLALQGVAGPLGGSLVKDLEQIDFGLFFGLEDWRGGFALAFDALAFQPQVDQVLDAWANRELNPRIVDAVLFDQVRPGRVSPVQASRWIELARTYAEMHRDTSLLETLALTLGETFKADPLFQLAQSLSTRDQRLARVMRKYL